MQEPVTILDKRTRAIPARCVPATIPARQARGSNAALIDRLIRQANEASPTLVAATIVDMAAIATAVRKAMTDASVSQIPE